MVDAATLDLLEHVVTHAEVGHLLIIGAYRDNEVGEAHALSRTLERIKAGRREGERAGPRAARFPRRREAARRRARLRRRRVEPLSHLVQEKTGGNPFFTIQFVAALSDAKLIAFDPPFAAGPGTCLQFERGTSRTTSQI